MCDVAGRDGLLVPRGVRARDFVSEAWALRLDEQEQQGMPPVINTNIEAYPIRAYNMQVPT
jgi:hypothetical protein